MIRVLLQAPHEKMLRDLGLFSLEKTEGGSYQCKTLSVGWMGLGSFAICPATGQGAVGIDWNTASSMQT